MLPVRVIVDVSREMSVLVDSSVWFVDVLMLVEVLEKDSLSE